MTRDIGLDIGHHTVRALAGERKRAGWRVVAFGSVPRCDASGEPRPLAAVLAELDAIVPLTKGRLSVADSARNLLVRYLPTVPLPPDRLVKLLRLELAQHAGEAGELAADVYEVPLAGEEVIHGAVLAQPEQIRDLLTDLRRMKITPQRIHVGAAALANATLVAPVVQDPELALVVDIGSATTRVALVGAGARLLAFRELAIGGDAFTHALAEAHGLTPNQAERRKLGREAVSDPSSDPAETGATAVATPKAWSLGVIPVSTAAAPTEVVEPGEEEFLIIEDRSATDDGLPGFLDEPAPHPTTLSAPPTALPPAIPAMAARSSQHLAFDEDDAPSAPGHKTIEIGGNVLGPELSRVAEQLYTQLASTVTWFKAQLQNANVVPNRVALCGGGAVLTGLEAYLSRRFKLPVDRYDPVADGESIPLGHEYVLALGLALSEDPAAVRLDLLPEKEVISRAWRDRLAWPYVAAALLVVATVCLAWTVLGAQSAHQESLTNLEAYKANRDKLLAELKSQEEDRTALSDDLRTIASGIHFNRDLLYVIRVLKELTLTNKELWVTRLETVPLQLEKATPGRRPTLGGVGASTAKANAVTETALDRGAVEIEGRVKFDQGRNPDVEATNLFFNNYMKSLDAAVAGSSGQALFDPAQTKVFLHWQHEEEIKPGTKAGSKQRPADGSFPFGVRFVFLPTDLSQATATIESVP